MEYFFDTEFADHGGVVDLISIGMVASDGREYYAISKEFDPNKCNDWVKKNVLNQLPPSTDSRWKLLKRIKHDLERFVGDDKKPHFIAYFASYDWLMICQLFGGLMSLPASWPSYVLDLQQMRYHLSFPAATIQKKGQHDALEDARWVRDEYNHLFSLRFTSTVP